ncbi:DegT/DnrJ/EryC1/StrS family aminotransferase [Candidatus Nitrosotenuis chungbukensis]|uniref:DegT/DnrJ/EryC1/StrS family aminotransferase n=1 Tax=Candidatus Nitrosotenuis chungbukensis TaxID=1353246 RepID=UPI0005B28A7E|nr:DegT/DnrJ/EryC1/StrS family aminotransferase [Candidatus Nitrosotenuis chungbukensis]WKT58305.1 DegT/DnrJ/EryC1/StrS family aminotransferase [Candidatus Nitrosotenuis chungbukensis]
MNTSNPEDWIIPLYKVYTDDDDVNLITKVIKRGTHWAIGPEIEEFEKMIADYIGCDYCLTLNSGTSALHAALLAYGVGSGDEVIVPSFSFISTANSVLFVNANPIFADIEENNFGLDPASIQNKISPKTKAVIPMDYGGLSCKISEISNVTKENNLTLIEDAAEALGSSVNGKKTGSFADITIFSFCGNKVLTTGEGGAIVTNSKETYERIKSLRSHGRLDRVSYFNNASDPEYLSLGYNWRMSSITAALGISQLQKLDKIIMMRKENARYISSKLSKYSDHIKFPYDSNNYNNIYQMYTIMLNDQKTRDDLQKFLISKKIFSKVYFSPIHLTDYYKTRFNLGEGYLPVTEQISKKVLTLPIYPNMNDEEKNYLVNSVSEFFELYI